MARKPRFNLAGYPQHVIQRGHNRSPCFFAEEDYSLYLHYLKTACHERECALHAYVLTNHVHLLMTPAVPHAVSWVVQDVGRCYVHSINRSYKRSGTLWEGRFKSSLIQSERHLLTCYRYIELNPVRAQMVDHPGDYRWSSYHANAYGKPDPRLTPHDEYTRLGSNSSQRQHAYRELFRHHMDNETLHNVRNALNQELVLGSSRFKDEIETTLNRQTRPHKLGRPRLENKKGLY